MVDPLHHGPLGGTILEEGSNIINQADLEGYLGTMGFVHGHIKSRHHSAARRHEVVLWRFVVPFRSRKDANLTPDAKPMALHVKKMLFLMVWSSCASALVVVPGSRRTGAGVMMPGGRSLGSVGRPLGAPGSVRLQGASASSEGFDGPALAGTVSRSLAVGAVGGATVAAFRYAVALLESERYAPALAAFVHLKRLDCDAP